VNTLSDTFPIWAAIVALTGGWIAFEVRQMRTRLDRFLVRTHGRLTAIETHLRYRDGYQPGEDYNDS
jgi:hypothetical protein